MRLSPCVVLGLALYLASGLPPGVPATVLSQERADCKDWRDCQDLALQAAQQRRFEVFHDFAWRAVQTAPDKDPGLRYLLARAQARSGRPYDALITLQRLAEELGVVTDADVHDDFQQVRLQRDWPLVEAAVERARAAGAATLTAAPMDLLATTSVLTPAPTIVAMPALGAPVVPIAPAPIDLAETVATLPTAETPVPGGIPTLPGEDVARFSTQRFAAGGLAYDAVSGRYLLGDLHGRKLMVVGDGSDHTVEMVRGESAGFFEVTGLAIDTRRGDLWVTSTAPGGGSGALHRLQLISGRPLRTFAVDSIMEPVRLSDVAVTSAGTVLVLDSLGRRILFRAPDGTSLESLVTLDASEPLSLAVTADGTIVHVAHREGLLRLDVPTKTVTSVTGAAEIDLGGLERIRRHRDAIIGVQIGADGSRRIVQLSLDAGGKAVTGSTLIADAIPRGEGEGNGPMFVTVSNDEVSFLSGKPRGAAATQPAEAAAGALIEYVVRRIPLK